MGARILPTLLAALLFVGSGCATTRPVAQNPIFVPANDHEAVWERTVDVVHTYFEIARENKLDGVIETEAKPGASVLEPWHKDSPGLHNKMESTLQSIRRRAYINVTPTNGGYLVGVEVFKELEDNPGLAANTPGAATFQQTNPLRRDLNLVVGQSTPAGWVMLGRDEVLEATMIQSLQQEFSR
jgi:hypothetical protein